MEKKAGIRQAEDGRVPAGGCCCRLLCTLKRHAPRALINIFSAEATAMMVASGPNSRLRKTPAL
jgi:hypothetical protein